MSEFRRSVMHQTSDPHGNARSGIPMPATTKKPANKRMSIAGPAQRGPYPQSLQVPGTNPRQSVARSQNMNPLLASAVKQNHGRTPLHNSTARRGSMFPGAMAAPSNNQTMKDPRPLRERSYQAKMRNDLSDWLRHTDCEVPMQTLISMTGKDFRAIFQHLVLLLDPCYVFDKAKIEDEFIPALKALRYPFVSAIDNKWLAAPASMHSWPSLLGALHWLSELGRAQDYYLESRHPTLQDPNDVPDEFDDPNHHQALAHDYHEKAYSVFLSGSDDISEQDQELEERYARKNERVVEDLEEKRRQLHESRAEYEKLVSQPAPLDRLKKDNANLKRDQEKFNECLKRYNARKQGLTETIAYEKADLAQRATELEKMRSEQEKLSEVVKTQNLSPEEVIRMNTDHQTLTRNLEDLKHKISEANRTVMSLEVSVANRTSAAEEALDAYNNLLASLGLYPPLPAPWQDIDLTLTLNTAVANPQQMLSGADVRKVVKPTLNSMADSKRKERAEVEDEKIKVEDEYEQLTLECENVEEEIAELEKKVAGLNEQADDLRETTTQDALVSSNEAQRLERELAHARTAAHANGMSVKSRLQTLHVQYREQVEKVARVRDATVRAIVKNSHDIAMFKQEVSQQLLSLKDFAEAN